MQAILLTIVLAPLVGAIIAGLFRNQVGKVGAHSVTILGVGISCVLSLYILWLHAFQGAPVYNETVYTWMVTDGLRMEIGFLVDSFNQVTEALKSGGETRSLLHRDLYPEQVLGAGERGTSGDPREDAAFVDESAGPLDRLAGTYHPLAVEDVEAVPVLEHRRDVRLPDVAQALRRHRLYGDPALEVLHPESAVGAGETVGGQDVVRAGTVVAQGLGRTMASLHDHS